jgi:hypothetical protein
MLNWLRNRQEIVFFSILPRADARLATLWWTISRMASEDWRSKLAGAFQDFFKFEFRTRQTIGVGDLTMADNADAVEQVQRHANHNGRITILVSHRFSTVRMADQIVVLDGACLVETGSHEELMKRNGQYAELYAIQADAYH